jgi:hypothetical protein
MQYEENCYSGITWHPMQIQMILLHACALRNGVIFILGEHFHSLVHVHSSIQDSVETYIHEFRIWTTR